MRNLVRGVGINDADCTTHPTVNGCRVVCHFYRTWSNMMDRCYNEKYQEKYPTYKGCEVSPVWVRFSNFKIWMSSQDWFGKQLDKDILIPGNRIYGPERCVFVPRSLNLFLIDNNSARGRFKIGAAWDPKNKKFISACKNPFTKKSENLGRFKTEEEAHQAWKKRKHELACIYADMQTDRRVADALRSRFL